MSRELSALEKSSLCADIGFVEGLLAVLNTVVKDAYVNAAIKEANDRLNGMFKLISCTT